MPALRQKQPSEFETVGSNTLADVWAVTEQEVPAGQQFDGSVGKGRWTYDGAQGRSFVKLVFLKDGGETINVSFDLVDDKGRRAPLYTKVGMAETSLVLLGNVLVEPWEHLELVTTGAITALYAKVDTKR